MSKNPTVKGLKKFARDNADLGKALVAAGIFAQIERRRVDAYAEPLFRTFNFLDENGEPVTLSKQLFVVNDQDAKVAEWFAALDAEHRKHGFTGPTGHCPALVAEHDVLKLEWALIEAGEKVFGINASHLWKPENRKKYLELLTGVCVKASHETAAQTAVAR